MLNGKDAIIRLTVTFIKRYVYINMFFSEPYTYSKKQKEFELGFFRYASKPYLRRCSSCWYIRFC